MDLFSLFMVFPLYEKDVFFSKVFETYLLVFNSIINEKPGYWQRWISGILNDVRYEMSIFPGVSVHFFSYFLDLK